MSNPLDFLTTHTATPRRNREKTLQKYLVVLQEIYHKAIHGAEINFALISAEHHITNGFNSLLIQVGIIRKTEHGILWLAGRPNEAMAQKILDFKLAQCKESARYKKEMAAAQIEVFAIDAEPLPEPAKEPEPAAPGWTITLPADFLQKQDEIHAMLTTLFTALK